MNLKRVEAVNPIYGMRIIDKYDPHPCGYSEDALIGILNSVSDTRHDYDMLMECASFEEVDAYYNPGIENITDDFILEAIVVDKFSKTERRMAAVVRVMNKHLGDSEINALAPIVGKPKKTGSYAYVTVQLPFSDGQVVSIIFHAPEGDKKKIGPSDQIIAFRWLLNKRDITQVVAPEDGSEISLESIAKRVTQLVVKNSARFERTQKEAQAERQELEKAREDLKEAQARQEELIQNMETSSKDNETLAAQLSNTLALLEKQKTINAELQAKLDAHRKSGQGDKENASGGSGFDALFGPSFPEFTGKPEQAIEHLLKEKKGYVPGAFFKEGLGPIDLPWGDKKKGLAHIIDRRNKEGLDGLVFAKSLPEIIKNGRIESREDKPGRKYIVDEKSEAVVGLEWHGDRQTWLLTAYPLKENSPANSGQEVDFDQTNTDGKTPPPGKQGNTNIGTDASAVNPQFVQDMNDILAGKYDSDSSKVIELLENAINEAESTGLMEQYESLLNEASNHLTDLLAEEAKNV